MKGNIHICVFTFYADITTIIMTHAWEVKTWQWYAKNQEHSESLYAPLKKILINTSTQFIILCIRLIRRTQWTFLDIKANKRIPGCWFHEWWGWGWGVGVGWGVTSLCGKRNFACIHICTCRIILGFSHIATNKWIKCTNIKTFHFKDSLQTSRQGGHWGNHTKTNVWIGKMKNLSKHS